MPSDSEPFAAARAALDQALRVADAALGLLRAELRLARSSAFVLIWLAFALVFLGVGAWLATSAAIAAGIYQLTGNVFYGIGSVALANLIGVVAVLWAMRGCWHDLALPQTRRMLGHIGKPTPQIDGTTHEAA
ncbi:MAG: hypothetical protein ABI843_04970 [Dokdonella sp.]